MEISQLQNSIHPLYGTHQMLQEPRFHWLGERCLFCVLIIHKSSKLVSLCHLEQWPERRYQLWRKSNDKSTILRMQSNATGSRSMIKSLILPYFIFPSIKDFIQSIQYIFLSLSKIMNHHFVCFQIPFQWQNRTRSIIYLIYRLFLAGFFIAVVIDSMIDHYRMANFGLYFIYMTNWGIMMCMITNVYAAILVLIWHYRPEYAGKLKRLQQSQP